MMGNNIDFDIPASSFKEEERFVRRLAKVAALDENR